MSIKKLCVINNFFNVEHIKLCFNSLKNDSTDFFILENKSKYSPEIESFFKNENILGYLQAQENITHGTVDFFYENYKELINSYEYFTITDGDILVDNINQVYDEIISILNEPKVMVCSVDLELDNLPDLPNANKWIPQGKVVNDKYIQANTGTHLMTFKKEFYFIFLNLTHMIDSNVHKHITENGGISAKTLKNKAKHLTWDLYYPGNEYYEWKIKNQWTLTTHNRPKNIKKII